MFYWLTELSDKVSFFNVFRYITFRTGGAIVTALVFVFLFGGPIIDLLRIKQGKGQPIRSDGPQSHLVTKKGTPTMGGLMILSGLLVSTLLTLVVIPVVYDLMDRRGDAYYRERGRRHRGELDDATDGAVAGGSLMEGAA